MPEHSLYEQPDRLTNGCLVTDCGAGYKLLTSTVS